MAGGKGDEQEKVLRRAGRNWASRHRHVVGGHARVRPRRLRTEPPSRWLGSLRFRRPKSGLVPEAEGPSRHPHARRHAALPIGGGARLRRRASRPESWSYAAARAAKTTRPEQRPFWARRAFFTTPDVHRATGRGGRRPR